MKYIGKTFEFILDMTVEKYNLSEYVVIEQDNADVHVFKMEEEDKKHLFDWTVEDVEKKAGKHIDAYARTEKISFYIDGKVVHTLDNGDKTPLRMMVFKPNQPGQVVEIPYSERRDYWKKTVEGELDFVLLTTELTLICNDMGMINKLPQHRGYYGNFIVVGTNEDGDTVSITDEQIELCRQKLDDKENYESKNKYLVKYFEEKSLEHVMFKVETPYGTHFIGSEVVVEHILGLDDELSLKSIEKEIKRIEKEGLNIYDFLNQFAKEMVK